MVTLAEPISPEAARFGRYFAELRKQAGYTQRALAEELNLSESYFGHVERGARGIDRVVLQQAAKLIRADGDELAALAGFIKPREGNEPIFTSPEKASIARRVLSYPVEKIRQAELWLSLSTTEETDESGKPVRPSDEPSDKPNEHDQRVADNHKTEADTESSTSP